MIRKTVPLRNAVLYVMNLIGDTNSTNGSLRLPPIKTLAFQAGVSSSTMEKAITFLKGKGLVAPRQGRGTQIIAKQLVQIESAKELLNCDNKNVDTHKAIQEILSRDIITGMYHTGEFLPSCKELQKRYGASFTTVKKALLANVNAGNIQKINKRFKVSGPRQHSFSAVIILITSTSNMNILSKSTNRSPEFWRYLEREFLRRDITLKIVSYFEFTSQSQKDKSSQSEFAGKNQSILGYIIWINENSQLNHTCRLARQQGKPIAVMDENGITGLDTEFVQSPLNRVFSISNNFDAGEKVGNYLLQLGHRTIACFSQYKEISWSNQRVLGLQTAFEKAGIKEGVKEYNWEKLDMYEECLNLATIVEPFKTHNNIVKVMQKLIKSYYDSTVEYETSIKLQLWSMHVKKLVDSAFNKAYEKKDISAWVTVNDSVGINAMDFLQNKPAINNKKISLIGFDDMVESFGYGLSSYNFNITGLTAAMISHIVDRKTFRSQSGIISIPGFIMERNSTSSVS